MFDNLSAPAREKLVSINSFQASVTHYRLGKNLPGSGILSRLSRSALRLQVTAITPSIAAPRTAVLAFQFAGRAYQPPAGDQTSLGYLKSQLLPVQPASSQHPALNTSQTPAEDTHCILAPPPILIAIPDSTRWKCLLIARCSPVVQPKSPAPAVP